MITRLLMAAVTCAVALPMATADAQNTMTRNQIVNSLYQTGGDCGAVGSYRPGT
ncbi:MAG: hypothetical protein AAF692_09085 [Pseudomonadota bacterium]